MAARGKESSRETKNDLAVDSGSREKKDRVAWLAHCESSSQRQRILKGECYGLMCLLAWWVMMMMMTIEITVGWRAACWTLSCYHYKFSITVMLDDGDLLNSVQQMLGWQFYTRSKNHQRKGRNWEKGWRVWEEGEKGRIQPPVHLPLSSTLPLSPTPPLFS